MDRIFNLLRVHVLAYFCWLLAFFFWKDYLTHPHQRVSVESLAYTTGPVKNLSGLVSLPSGSRSGTWLMLDSPRRDFDLPSALDSRLRDMKEGTEVTIGYSPEEDPARATAQAFSLKLRGEECLSPDILVRGYNEALDRKQRNAIGATAAGFLALAIVEIVRRKLAARR